MISGASIDRCVRILLTTFYHAHAPLHCAATGEMVKYSSAEISNISTLKPKDKAKNCIVDSLRTVTSDESTCMNYRKTYTHQWRIQDLTKGVLNDLCAKIWKPRPLFLTTPTIFARYWVCIIKNRPCSPLKNDENVQVSSY